jgi:hypothetical protein
MKVTMPFAKSLMLLLAVSSMTLMTQSCSKDEDPPATAKTLDKAKLYNKKWYPSPQTVIHHIKSDGTYSIDGTWKWINNSDTMEIVPADGLPAVKWKFYWCTDKEMSCDRVGETGGVLFKDAPW